MGGTLRRRIICCWSSLRAKTVSLPVQSLCSWIQNTVNAFGTITKKTLTWLWQAGALSGTQDTGHSMTFQETQEQPGQGTVIDGRLRLRGSEKTATVSLEVSNTEHGRETEWCLPAHCQNSRCRHILCIPGITCWHFPFTPKPFQGSPSVSGNDGWELHFLGSCVSKVPAMV